VQTSRCENIRGRASVRQIQRETASERQRERQREGKTDRGIGRETERERERERRRQRQRERERETVAAQRQSVTGRRGRDKAEGRLEHLGGMEGGQRRWCDDGPLGFVGAPYH
jgi:hypothetical protein